MLIAKVGLTILFATAGLWLFSDPNTPADPAGSVQSATYEEFMQATDVNYLVAVQPDF